MRKAFFGDICRVLKSGSGQAGLETTGFSKVARSSETTCPVPIPD